MSYKQGYSRYLRWQRVKTIIIAASVLALTLLVHACVPIEEYKQRYGDWVEWIAVAGPIVLTVALCVLISMLPKTVRTRRCARCGASLERERMVNIDDLTVRCSQCGHESPITDVLDWDEIEMLVDGFLAGASSEEEKEMARQFRNEVIGHEERPPHTYLDTNRDRNRWQLRWIVVLAGGGTFVGGLLGGWPGAVSGAFAGAFAGLVGSGVILLVKNRRGDQNTDGQK